MTRSVEARCRHCGGLVDPLTPHYCAIAKVGTRGREWQIVNQHGGIREELSGTKAQADARVAAVTAEAIQHRADNMADLERAELASAESFR